MTRLALLALLVLACQERSAVQNPPPSPPPPPPPFGLAFRGDTLYFAEQHAVRRLAPGSGAPVTLVQNVPGGGRHITRTLVFGPDNRMYLSAGSTCDGCDDSDPRLAAVTRYNLDGSGEHVFATGLRNSVGMAFHPTTGELWANNNDRDGLGSRLRDRLAACRRL